MAGEKKGLVLLDFWVSPFGQRCRIALAEKGLPYEYVEEDLLAGKSDLLLRSNPVHKKIPVLLHDGRPINESLIILQYLDEAFPETKPLLPADPYARAQARFWADYVDKKVYDCGTRLWKLKGEPQAQARREMVEILKTLEGALGEGEFFGGAEFGFVDAALAPFTAWFHSYEPAARATTRRAGARGRPSPCSSRGAATSTARRSPRSHSSARAARCRGAPRSARRSSGCTPPSSPRPSPTRTTNSSRKDAPALFYLHSTPK